ncbi:cation transporter ChaC [Trichophyton tonsurans CBS 112818]|uniref:glutathione-specific gamma-glutamylcyclotransferase n=2 Tax=Trichophyton TaxID=5550 RepID=F2Q2C1_TRIEC|nr:cation transporter ChaC [Trichophyton tonsurans CBS 112818]EGE08289.1 cation transporter ChaC [Trichophyton equinum CBS 127.97]
MASTELQSWKSHFPAGDLWVFGYGSLIWKPPPHYDQRVAGYIKGYVRRFWQPTTAITDGKCSHISSTDHRGTPEAPGRVVTVIERSFWESLSDPQQDLERTTDGSLVWGAAYHIPASHAEEVSAYLDDREIDGYSVHYTPFYPCSSSKNDEAQSAAGLQSRKCLVYIGLPSNTQFVREPALREPDAIAEVIYASRGQSGENKDYLYALETALEGLGLGSSDVHVTDLVRRVKALEQGG